MTAALPVFTERVFGPDRAAMLTTQLPASAAGQADAATSKPPPSAARSPASIAEPR